MKKIAGMLFRSMDLMSCLKCGRYTFLVSIKFFMHLVFVFYFNFVIINEKLNNFKVNNLENKIKDIFKLLLGLLSH